MRRSSNVARDACTRLDGPAAQDQAVSCDDVVDAIREQAALLKSGDFDAGMSSTYREPRHNVGGYVRRLAPNKITVV